MCQRLLPCPEARELIYRFSGAEIPVMPDFGERLGNSERTELETTYRCSEPVAADATAAKRSGCLPRVALGCEPGLARTAASSPARTGRLPTTPGMLRDISGTARDSSALRLGADDFNAAGALTGLPTRVVLWLGADHP